MEEVSVYNHFAYRIKIGSYIIFRDTLMKPQLERSRCFPQINRLSLIWNQSDEQTNSATESSQSSSFIENPYSPLPIPNFLNEPQYTISTDSLMPLTCQTSLMQMSSNQYYLVVQINVQNQDSNNDKKHVYENYP